MKKPSKEQRYVWNSNYSQKNKEYLKQRRRKINPKKNNTRSIEESVASHQKRKEAFDKSYFGLELIKQKLVR